MNMMVALQLFAGVGIAKNKAQAQIHCNNRPSLWSTHLSVYNNDPYKRYLRCQSSLNPGHTVPVASLRNTATTMIRSYHTFQNSLYVLKVVPAVAIVVFAIWGVEPLLRQSRKIFLHNDSNWKKSSAYYVMTSYIQPLLLWTAAILLCRTVDPVVLPTEASQVVKARLINFVRSLSTVVAFAYCLSSAIQHAQNFFMEPNEPKDPRNMGFQFAVKAVYSAVWIAAASLFMELLGFSTQKWLTAGGLGTVLLTLAGREIFTNFLASAIIHATRPFVLNEWIQTKIEGYEVSGTVEHVGWWSPTIIRGENRETVYIPNHKFNVNVVRNLTQKTHWRIKTHLAISHLDVSKINNLVADMRKVVGKNPHVEQQKLHRRVFLENVNPENQALMILVSCFVKTSHYEEYLSVKEGILMDLLRVIRHHHARLATPIRTIHKMQIDDELGKVPFADSSFGNGATSNRPVLLIEPPYKINEEYKTKSQSLSACQKSEENSRGGISAVDLKTKETTGTNDLKTKETTAPKNAKDILMHDVRADGTVDQNPDVPSTEANNAVLKPSSDVKDGRRMRKSSSNIPSVELNNMIISRSDSKVLTSNSNSCATSKKPKKVEPEISHLDKAVDKSVSKFESPDENTLSRSSNMQSKSHDHRQSVTQSPVSVSSLEGNIVLGVALEGSKRTLPIEDIMVSPANLAGEKELAMSRSGNGSPISGKDKSEGKDLDTRVTTTDDLQNQQE